jgi:hypothetical protein
VRRPAFGARAQVADAPGIQVNLEFHRESVDEEGARRFVLVVSGTGGLEEASSQRKVVCSATIHVATMSS